MAQATLVTRRRTCNWCGVEFDSARRVKLCSIECRRAKVAHRIASSFSPAERLAILNRDGWCCGICDQPISPDIRWPHPRSASVDHITPVMHGGTRSLANAQAAHLTCNRTKWTDLTSPDA